MRGMLSRYTPIEGWKIVAWCTERFGHRSSTLADAANVSPPREFGGPLDQGRPSRCVCGNHRMQSVALAIVVVVIVSVKGGPEARLDRSRSRQPHFEQFRLSRNLFPSLACSVSPLLRLTMPSKLWAGLKMARFGKSAPTRCLPEPPLIGCRASLLNRVAAIGGYLGNILAFTSPGWRFPELALAAQERVGREADMRGSIGTMGWKPRRRVGFYALVFVLYLVSTVPVGLLLYGIKNGLGIQLFREGGLHDFMRCVKVSFD